jgi:hypothetical protein
LNVWRSLVYEQPMTSTVLTRQGWSGLFSVSEPMDIRSDSLSPVGDYPRSFAFTEELKQLVIELK